MTAANVALVILVELACCFFGGLIAGIVTGFLAAFLGLPPMLAFTGLLTIPSMLGVGYFAGRWLARRRPSPTALEIKIGCVVYTVASAMLTGVVHPAAGALSLITVGAMSFVLYRSAQRTGLRAAVIAGGAA